MQALSKIAFLLLLFFLTSCQTKNEYNTIKTVDGIIYDLQYYVANDTTSNIKPADLFYYKLTIYEKNKSAPRISEIYLQKNYNKLLQYVNSGINSDFKTIVNDKEMLPVQVFFENNNRISQKLVFLIAFEKPVIKEGDLTIEFNDNIFNNGKIKFKYSIESLI